jgi:restriction system protein
MGGIWFGGAEFVAFLSEMVGFKTGLVLSAERLKGILDDIDPRLWPPSDDLTMRIRSDEFEEVCAGVLWRLGAGPPEVIYPKWEIERRNASDRERLAVVEALEPQLNEFQDHALQLGFLPDAIRREQPASDPRALVGAAADSHGSIGREIAEQFVEALDTYLSQSPFHRMRRIEWRDVRDLDDLFQTESLDSFHGEYFDQRFVDFLDANLSDIDQINWRQFEGLAAEFFHRIGFRVVLGAGRNDEGVDIRLWPAEAEEKKAIPAVTLVQCKRERRKVTKTVVKALWADVVAEDAKSGLVVTSSSFSPGARATRTARGYSIEEANRETLRRWIRSMRTPGSGIFLGE